ncbi:MAG: hypothetical protein K0Q72_1005 [Armatimonadetes bacterium]|nr:hypothetical protein [Armatimonadota bacterium]
MRSRPQLGSILLRLGVITQEQLDLALAHHKANQMRLGEALLTLGFCRDAEITRALAEQLGLPFVDLEETPPSREAMREVSWILARQLGVVPVEKKHGRLVVVARNPLDFSIDAALRQAVGMPVTIVSGVESQITRILDRYDQILVGGHAPLATENSHPYLSSRLGGRVGVQEVRRFQEGAVSPSRLGALISGYLGEGKWSVELAFFHNTLRVTGVTGDRREPLAELPGDEFRFTIAAPQASAAP